MIGISFRILWRILILLLGVALAFGVIDTAYPFLHQYLPIWIVFLILYIGLAYIGIPALIRLWRMVIKPNHLPVYATTRDGWASDPVNIAVVCKSESHLVRSMEKAGWTLYDEYNFFNFIKTGFALLLKRPYTKATMSRLYLFNRYQDLSFQLQDGNSPSPHSRHHVRFWRLKTTDSEHEHHDFWHNLLRLFKRQRSEIWIGAATHDISIFSLRRDFQITHNMDADTNKERDFLIKTLDDSNKIKEEPEFVDTGHVLEFKGQQFGINIIVDGRLKVIRLKK
ncbi:MAG: LssY C-terminal domain-containing protein [Candidatus Saccharibacteria bacterium]|nr:LssY C-terminal domain-containing protein [Candidatus Saccharibacteria bacterium]